MSQRICTKWEKNVYPALNFYDDPFIAGSNDACYSHNSGKKLILLYKDALLLITNDSKDI